MSRINIVALIGFVGLLVWIFLFGENTVQRIQRGAMALTDPFTKGAYAVEKSVSGFSDEEMSESELRARFRELEFERDRLKLEVLRIDELYEENNALRDALNYVRDFPRQLIPARVISRKPTTWYNTMMIDKGSKDGIETDSPVPVIVPVGEDAALVGKVTKVFDHSALVILLSDETCQVSARIEGTTEQGIMSGQRGAFRVMPDLRLRYLSKDADFEPGRNVITSGAGGLFPENLLLGRIKEFKTGAITGEAIVEAGVNFDVLENVFVVLPEKEMDPDEPPSGEPPTRTSATPTRTTATPIQ